MNINIGSMPPSMPCMQPSMAGSQGPLNFLNDAMQGLGSVVGGAMQGLGSLGGGLANAAGGLANAASTLMQGPLSLLKML